MSAKISAARRSAFLKALRETGNVTVSAERAKVSRSWVLLRRKGDAEFDRACRGALAAAKARLSGADGRRPPSGWGFLDGEELVVKGSNGRRVQIARARARQWTPRVEQRFLATLGATCNVKAACAEAGMTAASAYTHRKRWPGFERRWDEAIETGYARIEIALLESACGLLSAHEPPAVAPMPDMTAEQALQLLHMHKHQVKGIGRRPGLPERQPTWEEVGAYFTRRIEAIERARGLSAKDRARTERQWALRRGQG